MGYHPQMTATSERTQNIAEDANAETVYGQFGSGSISPSSGGINGMMGTGTGLKTEYGYTAIPGGELAYDPRTYAIGTAGFDKMSGLAPGNAKYSNNLMQMLASAAAGNAPSAAQMQQQQGLDSILRSQLAARASQRGSGAVGASNRLVGEQANQAQLGVAMNNAILRAKEMEGARGQLLSAEQSQADLQKTYEDLRLKYLAMGYSMDEANRQANITAATLQSQSAASLYALNKNIEAQMIGAGLEAGGSVIQGVSNLVG